jgi:hypothetical protein
MKRSHQLIVGGAAALLVFFFAWEWYLSPQARIERFLSRTAEAAEEMDADRLLESFSRQYSDFRGMDFDRISELIDRGFERVDRLNVTLQGVRAEETGDEATASFDLMVVAIRGEERYLLVGRPMQPESLQVGLVKESGDWKIAEVERAASEHQP